MKNLPILALLFLFACAPDSHELDSWPIKEAIRRMEKEHRREANQLAFITKRNGNKGFDLRALQVIKDMYANRKLENHLYNQHLLQHFEPSAFIKENHERSEYDEQEEKFRIKMYKEMEMIQSVSKNTNLITFNKLLLAREFVESIILLDARYKIDNVCGGFSKLSSLYKIEANDDTLNTGSNFTFACVPNPKIHPKSASYQAEKNTRFTFYLDDKIIPMEQQIKHSGGIQIVTVHPTQKGNYRITKSIQLKTLLGDTTLVFERSFYVK